MNSGRSVGITAHNFVSFAHADPALCFRSVPFRCRVTPKSSRGGKSVYRAGESGIAGVKTFLPETISGIAGGISRIPAGDSAFPDGISGFAGIISGFAAGDSGFAGTKTFIPGTISGFTGGISGIPGTISAIPAGISGFAGMKTFCPASLSTSIYAKPTFLACIAGQKASFRRHTPDFLRCSLNHQHSTNN